MYVMMDVEWMSGFPERITQIAGIRFDEQYQIHSSFFQRIAPKQQDHIDWNQVCFCGGSRKEFLNGKKARNVFQMLSMWLDAQDVLLWWNQEGVFHFKQCAKRIGANYANETCVIEKQVREHLKGRDSKKGSPYTLCKARSIPCPAPKHHSYNDAMTIINLLREMNLQVRQIAEMSKLTQNEEAKYALLEDGLVHQKNCPKCAGQQIKVSYYSITECLTEKACSCCAKDKAKATREKHNVFLYSTRGQEKIVHFSDCKDAERIVAGNLSAFITLKDAELCGYRLCKTCRSIERIVSRQREELERYAAENHLSFTINNGFLNVISRHDEWIIRIEDATGELRLYHHNNGGRHRKEATDLSDYHLQKWFEKSLLKYFEYIVRHDVYAKRRDKKGGKREDDAAYKIKGKQKYKRTRFNYDDFDDDFYTGALS